MFVILATKPLNDRTEGFRFNFLGYKGIYRKRKATNRYGKSTGDVMTGYHFGKRSVYFNRLHQSASFITLQGRRIP